MKNLLDTAIREIHAELLAQNAEFCACERCRDDVVAYTLNHTRPRYATSSRGWALENLALSSDQIRAELSVMVLGAMKRVSQDPRHTPPLGIDRTAES